MRNYLNPGHKLWVQIDLQESIKISSIELLQFNCKFCPSVSFCCITMTYVLATYTIFIIQFYFYLPPPHGRGVMVSVGAVVGRGFEPQLDQNISTSP